MYAGEQPGEELPGSSYRNRYAVFLSFIWDSGAYYGNKTCNGELINKVQLKGGVHPAGEGLVLLVAHCVVGAGKLYMEEGSAAEGKANSLALKPLGRVSHNNNVGNAVAAPTQGSLKSVNYARYILLTR